VQLAFVLFEDGVGFCPFCVLGCFGVWFGVEVLELGVDISTYVSADVYDFGDGGGVYGCTC
jgi:hypothetical protein